MKNIKIISLRKMKIALLAFGVFFFSACLKDTGPVQDYSQSPALVGFQYKGSSNVPFKEAILPNPNDSILLEVTLSVPSVTQGAPVNVTIALDQASLDQYNTDNGTGYTMLDPSLYAIANGGKVTIPAGQQIVPLVITVAADKVDFDLNNALAFKITDASGAKIATNLNTAIYLINLKNIFDGQYSVDGTFSDNTNPAFLGDYPRTINLITDGKTAVDYFDVSLGDYGHTFDAAGTGSYYGFFAPIFTIDPVTGVVSDVTNYYGQGTNARARAAQLDPTGVNLYDFATRTLKVSYIMTQSGSPRTFFNETFTYIGSR